MTYVLIESVYVYIYVCKAHVSELCLFKLQRWHTFCLLSFPYVPVSVTVTKNAFESFNNY